MGRSARHKNRDDSILNVVDLEATCWDAYYGTGGHPLPEIIEIGITELDLRTRTFGCTEGILVRPRVGDISEFCTELTTITPEMVAEQPYLDTQVQYFREKYNTKNRIWASWGEYDKSQWQRECGRTNISYPFDSFHINIKAVFATLYQRRMGIDEALLAVGLPFTGTHHRGGDDSRNIAQLYLTLIDEIHNTGLIRETVKS